MFFVFLTANVFILGAELAAAWPHAHGEPERDEDPRTLRERLRAVVRTATGY